MFLFIKSVNLYFENGYKCFNSQEWIWQMIHWTWYWTIMHASLLLLFFFIWIVCVAMRGSSSAYFQFENFVILFSILLYLLELLDQKMYDWWVFFVMLKEKMWSEFTIGGVFHVIDMMHVSKMFDQEYVKNSSISLC